MAGRGQLKSRVRLHMRKELPDQANLDHLKAQAKSLLKTMRAERAGTRLHEAQHVLAQEYGFASWPKLVGEVTDRRLRREDQAASIAQIERGIADPVSARDSVRMLELKPELAGATLATALVALDLEEVRRQFRDFSPTGVLAQNPLFYAAFSPLNRREPERYEAVMRFLVERGADVGARYVLANHPEWPLSPLYAAVGLADHPGVCRLLLDAGADPNDGESVYHAAESRNPACLRMLLEAGGRVAANNAWARKLDYEDLDGLNVLLEFEAVGDEPVLIHAIRRGRSDVILRRLLEAGARPDVRGRDGVSGSELAFERGRIVEGILDGFEPSGLDHLLAACWRGDTAEAARLRVHADEASRERRKSFCDACWQGRAGSVDAFVAGGFSVTERDDSNSTPLHGACYSGQPEVVRALLKYGPPLDDAQDLYQAIPIQYAMHASDFGEFATEDERWAECVQLLIEAGSPRPKGLFGNAAVQEALLAHWPDLE